MNRVTWMVAAILFGASFTTQAASSHFYCAAPSEKVKAGIGSEIYYTVTMGKAYRITSHQQGAFQPQQPIRGDVFEDQVLANASSRWVSNADDCLSIISDDEQFVAKQKIYFEFDQSTLSPMAKEALRDKAVELKQESKSVLLVGNTDSKGSDNYNQKLGLKRAISTVDVLLNNGVSQQQASIETVGESQPVATNLTDVGRSKNRRVEFIELSQ
ncbi:MULTISPECIES: OmpA family protein [unclassified Vibrio]|uniref:OmpA family protein n=1 Tax=Vibrio sp. HB236076 TaxID=3232307 RepID=A0AB39HKT7_9VIBR|nr:OmpA family protein [Vibrio sp. HB161653]MDP5253165.1 OmpA family protein [Vibrio sp. HB161653]